MLKLYTWILVLFIFLNTPVISQKVWVLDDFEDNNLKESPEWWTFEKIKTDTILNNPKENAYLGRYSLHVFGETEGWYIGGMSAYVTKDLKGYDTLKLLIRSPAENSGQLVLQLFDDDNQNYFIEVNKDNQGVPTKDDLFVYTIDVDWVGWKVLIIPLSKFIDENEFVGDNIFNPYQENGSGGLIEFQVLLFSNQKEGIANLSLDAIKFYKMKKKQ